MQQFEAVLTALLGAWEEVKAAEEARAQLEAQLYKTKAQSTTILTEEVCSPLCHHITVRKPMVHVTYYTQVVLIYLAIQGQVRGHY
jgi:hypothetical protein